MHAQAPRRPQFSLRWLFAVTTAIAVCAFVFSLTGLLETILVAIAIAHVGVGVHLTWPLARRMAFAWGAMVGWFAVMDYSCFWEGCDHCHSHWFVTEVRVLHRPVWSRPYEDHSPLLGRVADDLGAPCPHEFTRWRVWRFWGCVWPQVSWSGTCCIATEDEWYSPEVREQVRAIGRQDPALGREFQRALVDRNHLCVKRIMQKIRKDATASNPDGF
jgi:hypothetical protein